MDMELLKVKEIDVKLARGLITNFHYLGVKGFRSGKNYGLFIGDNPIGAAIFHGLSAPETAVGAFGLDRDKQQGFLELGRLVLLPQFNGKNYGSFFLSRCLKDLKKQGFKAVISYATSDLHTGAVYQASNWKYYGTSDPKKDFYKDVDGKLIKQERGTTKSFKGVWVNRPIKHRYVYILDKGVDIKWQEQPYPKKNNADDTCYGCNGSGMIKDYQCPICSKG